MSNERITVFTPAYNRAHTLPRTYESLKRQKNKNFIWLIVDDGSTDNTKELVDSWKKEDNGFKIKYVYKENGGMHTAHNVAYDFIGAELNVCIDSDDCLADDAINKILNKWDLVKERGYAGIIGLDADFNGNVIGKGFDDKLSETTVIGYYANGGSGDKKLVYRTDIIKEYPKYPVFEGEKYVSLSYKYRLIDQKYKMAVLNEILCNVEYQPDGSSNTMWRQYLRNPKGWSFWRGVCLQYPTSFKRMIIDSIHYVSTNILAKNKSYIIKSPKPVLTFICLIPGWILSRIVIKKGK